MQSEKLQILEEILGSHYSSNDETLFFCPFCKHHKRKMSVNLSKNTFKCWICDSSGRNIYYLVKRFGNHYHKQTWRSFEKTVDISEFDNIFEDKKEEYVQRIKLPNEFICLANKSLPLTAQAPLNYLKKRGVEASDILKWKIGYCENGDYRNRIIIPSFNRDGFCNYFIARTYTEDWLKYKNPPTSKNIVFNELMINWKHPVAFVEGAFDALKADNAIPLLGSTLRRDTELFKRVLRYKPSVYMALDADAREKAFRIIDLLLQYDVKVWNIDTSDIEDVGSITKEEFLERKANAQLVNSDDLLLYKIAGI
jgi:DNA primase